MSPMMDDDFVGTLSDDELLPEEESLPEPAPTSKSIKRKRDEGKKKQTAVKKQKLDDNGDVIEDGDLDSDFEFGLEDNTAALDNYEIFAGDSKPSGKKLVDIEELVARRQGKPLSRQDDSDQDVAENEEDGEGIGMDDEDDEVDGFGAGADMAEGASDEDERDGDSDQESGEEEEEQKDNEDVDAAAPVPHPDDVASESEPEEDKAEVQRRNAFFAPEPKASNGPATTSFHSMSLSRPILKGLAEIGFAAPTPIQAKTIPVALEGKDVVGGAVTGSGKTGAFIIPILERLLYRPKKASTTRVAILMPTRELALQCFNVAKKLASFTDITFGQAIGGLNSREQEKQLKQRPDIVIATPGRFIDLERNSAALSVSTIEILVLDEADRMLEEGFADELNEILTKIPKSRQTMLFSATMTSKVDDLIRVGLQRPVRLMVDAQKQTVSGLVQEFVRLRPGREEKRLGYLMYLCDKVHTDRVIIFFRQKKDAHRIRVIFALCGFKAAELHGSMSQDQRIQAIEAFRSGRASFLLATDLASRGLDIKGIDTVINYEAPQSHEIYLHRVGRTARAGRTGRACTLAAEPDRRVVKAAVKAAKHQGAQIRQRTIMPQDADPWQDRIDSLESEIDAVLREEKEEKALSNTERDLTKADNLVTHREEILSRPKKTWFESESDKKSAKLKGATALNGPGGAGEAQGDRKKKGKLSNKQRKQLEDRDERREGKMWRKSKADQARVDGKGPKVTKAAKGKKPQEKKKSR